jgi:hypothetical protein
VATFAVLNKADHLDGPELAEAVEFTGRVLSEAGHVAKVYPMSARSALSAGAALSARSALSAGAALSAARPSCWPVLCAAGFPVNSAGGRPGSMSAVRPPAW